MTLQEFDEILDRDDTAPPATDVEHEFNEKAIDEAGALAWFEEVGIDATPVFKAAGRVALIDAAKTWDRAAQRHRFRILQPGETVVPGWDDFVLDQWVAIPVREAGRMVDLLVTSVEYGDFMTVCHSPWLGGDNIGVEEPLRLHRDPLEWLRAGCAGACHFHLCLRRTLKRLRSARQVICNDVHTALQAWEWAFEARDEELGRFVIDAEPGEVRAYFDKGVAHKVLRELGRELCLTTV